MLKYNMSVCDSPGCSQLKHTNPANNGGNYCCAKCKSSPNEHGPRCQSRLNARAAKSYLIAKSVKLAKDTATGPTALILTWRTTNITTCCDINIKGKLADNTPLNLTYSIEAENGVYSVNLFLANQIPAKRSRIVCKFQPLNLNSPANAPPLPIGKPLTLTLMNPYK
jgi:hypothetical protein